MMSMARPFGRSLDEAVRISRDRTLWARAVLIEARRYKRDRDGKFAGGGSGRSADFDARADAARSGKDATDSAPSGWARESTGLTSAQEAAFHEYQGLFGCQRINRGLRSGEMDERTKEDVRTIDGAMDASRLTGDVVVHRGLRDADAIFGDRLGGDLAGVTWTEKGYLSTSPRESAAKNWAREGTGRQDPSRRPITMRILAPKGTPAVEGHTDFELLLGRGLTLRVAADHGTVDGVRQIDIEVVP